MKLSEYLDKKIKELEDSEVYCYDCGVNIGQIETKVYEEIKAALESGEING